MKCISGEDLTLMAAKFAINLSKKYDSEEILAISDFLGMLNANLIAIADRRQYIENSNNDCETKNTNNSN